MSKKQLHHTDLRNNYITQVQERTSHRSKKQDHTDPRNNCITHVSYMTYVQETASHISKNNYITKVIKHLLNIITYIGREFFDKISFLE